MKHYGPFYLSLIFAAVIGGSISFTMSETANGQMMGGSDMKGMREMMQRMMGDVLPPGIDPALLPLPDSAGAQLLTRYCAQCHNLPGPGMHTAREWPPVVERMNRRMQMMSGHGMMGMMMGGVEAPSEKELQELIAYLQRHAQTPIDTTQYPDLDTPAGRSFQETCAKCHALPDPEQHTQTEWPPVVARMKQNIIAMHKPVPNEQVMKEIVMFLQRHAKDQQ